MADESRTKIVFSGAAELVVDQPASEIEELLRQSREQSIPILAVIKDGGEIPVVAESVAYVEAISDPKVSGPPIILKAPSRWKLT